MILTKIFEIKKYIPNILKLNNNIGKITICAESVTESISFILSINNINFRFILYLIFLFCIFSFLKKL